MRVVITGAHGQIGRALCQLAPASWTVVPAGSAQVDFADLDAVHDFIEETGPDVLVNCAAFTAVDLAESEPELAGLINGDAVRVIAELALRNKFRMVQLSTDFIFDGKRGRPYELDSRAKPISEYGRSKLVGEEAVLEVLGNDAAVIRTSWVYDSAGSNFVLTMLRLMAERDSLSIVSDQVGTPTWSKTVAEAVVDVVERKLGGIYHVTDAGVASWYDFAVAIFEEGMARGLLEKPVDIKAIRAVDYPTPAARPSYSVLDKSESWEQLDIEPRHWRVSLRAMLDELVMQGRA